MRSYIMLFTTANSFPFIKKEYKMRITFSLFAILNIKKKLLYNIVKMFNNNIHNITARSELRKLWVMVCFRDDGGIVRAGFTFFFSFVFFYLCNLGLKINSHLKPFLKARSLILI